MTQLQGKEAPVFPLLSKYRGKWLLLYFYPKDFTPGCTIEACSFRDHFSELAKEDISILGVSADTDASHEEFVREHKLPFPLLSDPDHQIARMYGAYGEKNIFGKKTEGIIRKSFLIDPRGVVVVQYDVVKPETHVSEVLNDIKKINN